MKQLIEVLHCDLQVTIHQGLIEAQADILEAIAGFVDNFHIEVMTLSAPQVHALLDYMHAHHAGSNSFLAAIKWGTTSVRLESFLSDSQMSLARGLKQPTKLEQEVNKFATALWTHIVHMASDPALMLNFKSQIPDITTIDLTGNEAVIEYRPLRGNIAWGL